MSQIVSLSETLLNAQFLLMGGLLNLHVSTPSPIRSPNPLLPRCWGGKSVESNTPKISTQALPCQVAQRYLIAAFSP